jgi:divalent metal cation (Fe/Co/Zn/Cd) transporter
MPLGPSQNDKRERLFRRANHLEWFSVSWNIVEAAVAGVSGAIAGSGALLGFGSDSLIETAASFILLWRLRKAGPRAAAREHSQAERTALKLISATFFLLASYLAVDGCYSLIVGEKPQSSLPGLILAALSLLVMPALALAKQITGRRLGSRALQAEAMETWVCAWLSLCLLTGVGLNLWLGWWWADPVGALAMLPVVVWQGWETMEEAG